MRRVVRVLAASAVWVALNGARGAAACTVINYTFQPDCFRDATATGCVFDPAKPDLGPQIAVWLTSADGTQYVDTLLVTNAVAVHGIGNRPGTWNLASGPRFPYGARAMALPIWGHARGELYTFVTMDGPPNVADENDELTGHENYSSPEPYFCRPMLLNEEIDAITCPSGLFRSDKGVLDASQPASYYPPRADLFDYGGGTNCIARIGYSGSCDPGDSAHYFAMNDVDTVAAATPAYGAPFTGSWVVPSELPAGDYALSVEVGKEFDTNAANAWPTEVSLMDATEYAGYGLQGNVGQPSVLYRVPFTYAPGVATTASVTDIAGYGDWSGATGTVNPPDATISSTPGSGAGRLLLTNGASGPGRVTVSLQSCSAVECDVTPSPLPLPVSFTATASGGTGAAISLLQSSETDGQPVIGYQVRYTAFGNTQPIDATSFPAWTAAGAVPAGPPGSISTLQIDGLTPLTDYAIGVSAVGVCGSSPVTFQRITTPAVKYVQLSGCFIATAAFGSDLAPEVASLRALRDAATSRSALARTAVDLYYRSSPPLARALAGSPVARAVVRAALRAVTR